MRSPSRHGPVVYKFGGTSVAQGSHIRQVASLVANGPERLIVVVSALSGVTDRLAALALAEDPALVEEGLTHLRARHLGVLAELALADEPAHRRSIEKRLSRLRAVVLDEGRGSRRAREDEILATGEDLSALIVAAAIRAAGRPAVAVDARQLLVTDARFGRAVPLEGETREACATALLPVLAEGTVAVVQGFVGATNEGRTTTLGRGGSDFSAAILGGAVDSEIVHLWTDVQGILSGDPAQVDSPRLLSEIGFEEAVELSWAGANVVHPVAAKWAVAKGVPLRIRSTFHPELPGTLIRNDVRGLVEIAAVSAKRKVALIKVRSLPAALPYGFLARVFGVLARHRLEVDLVATSHSSTAFTIDESEEIEAVARELSAFADVAVVRDLVTITVVGGGLMAEPGMSGKVLAAAREAAVHLISQASDVSLSLVVASHDAPALLRQIHATLIENRGDAARRSA